MRFSAACDWFRRLREHGVGVSFFFGPGWQLAAWASSWPLGATGPLPQAPKGLSVADVPPETCRWCSEPSVDQLIVVPGTKKRKLAPVCAEHRDYFIAQGQVTVLQEQEIKAEQRRKAAAKRARNAWR